MIEEFNDYGGERPEGQPKTTEFVLERFDDLYRSYLRGNFITGEELAQTVDGYPFMLAGGNEQLTREGALALFKYSCKRLPPGIFSDHSVTFHDNPDYFTSTGQRSSPANRQRWYTTTIEDGIPFSVMQIRSLTDIQESLSLLAAVEIVKKQANDDPSLVPALSSILEDIFPEENQEQLTTRVLDWKSKQLQIRCLFPKQKDLDHFKQQGVSEAAASTATLVRDRFEQLSSERMATQLGKTEEWESKILGLTRREQITDYLVKELVQLSSLPDKEERGRLAQQIMNAQSLEEIIDLAKSQLEATELNHPTAILFVPGPHAIRNLLGQHILDQKVTPSQKVTPRTKLTWYDYLFSEALHARELLIKYPPELRPADPDFPQFAGLGEQLHSYQDPNLFNHVDTAQSIPRVDLLQRIAIMQFLSRYKGEKPLLVALREELTSPSFEQKLGLFNLVPFDESPIAQSVYCLNFGHTQLTDKDNRSPSTHLIRQLKEQGVTILVIPYALGDLTYQTVTALANVFPIKIVGEIGKVGLIPTESTPEDTFIGRRVIPTTIVNQGEVYQRNGVDPQKIGTAYTSRDTGRNTNTVFGQVPNALLQTPEDIEEIRQYAEANNMLGVIGMEGLHLHLLQEHGVISQAAIIDYASDVVAVDGRLPKRSHRIDQSSGNKTRGALYIALLDMLKVFAEYFSNQH